VTGRELVVAEHGVPVAADVADRHLARALRIGIAERPPGADGRRRVDAVHLAVRLPVLAELGGHDVPGLLRDDQDADAELRHDVRRLR
jgi:hypothetical protein